MELQGRIVKRSELLPHQIEIMFSLMNEFYYNMDFERFLSDLNAKDYCVVLYNEDKLVGFSTQKLLSFPVCGREIHGVFSGDTIIHKDHWGSMELFKIFARFFLTYAKKYNEFYWFLISKGYKTYKILPTFFVDFYPNYQKEIPYDEKNIMDAYGKLLYPDEYDFESSVIKYRGIKDVLRAGVADIDERARRDKNIQFFEQSNPGYVQGYDLVCLARLCDNNLRPFVKRLLFPRETVG